MGKEKIFFLSLFLLAISAGNSLAAQGGAVSVNAQVLIVCGNSVIEEDEECDGSNLNSQTCSSRGYSGGSLSCSTGCVFDISACTSGGGGGNVGGGGGGGGETPISATKVILQGKAYPKAKITILIDGRVAVLIDTDNQAVFKTELTTLTAGVYSFGLWAEDTAGRKSITFSFTVTVIPNVTTTVSNIFLPPTIELSKVNLSKGEVLDISGQTAPKSEVSIYIGSKDEIIKKGTAKDDGDWKYSFDTNILEEGSHTVRASSESIEGLKSSFSKILSFFMGAYSLVGSCDRADFNKDGKTNLIDFSVMLYWWGKSSACVDMNKDGKVNLPDFSILMYYWTG